MAQKRQSNKKEKGVLKKRPQLKEIPQPTKLLLGMAFAIIMLSGYLLISNIVHAFAVSEKVVIDYSSYEAGVLKTTLHEMNANLIQLNQATAVAVCVPCGIYGYCYSSNIYFRVSALQRRKN